MDKLIIANVFLFLEDLVILESGKLCLDAKTRMVKTLQSCRSVVSTLKHLDHSINFMQKQRVKDQPPGCYSNNTGIYFNHHATGRRNRNANHICKTGNTYKKSSFNAETYITIVHVQKYSFHK